MGNIYVAGNKSTSDFKYFVKKFDSNGGFLWHSEINPSTQNDFLEDLHIDKFGNAYLVGTINEPNGGFEIAKFNTSGVLVWDIQYDTNVSNAL
jgi:hypothetical protein